MFRHRFSSSLDYKLFENLHEFDFLGLVQLWFGRLNVSFLKTVPFPEFAINANRFDRSSMKLSMILWKISLGSLGSLGLHVIFRNKFFLVEKNPLNLLFVFDVEVTNSSLTICPISNSKWPFNWSKELKEEVFRQIH